MSKISNNLLKIATNNFGEEREIYKTVITTIGENEVIDYVFKVRKEEYDFISGNLIKLVTKEITNEEMSVNISKYFIKYLTSLDIEDYSFEEFLNLPYNEHIAKIVETVQELMEITIKTVNDAIKKENEKLESLSIEERESFLNSYKENREEISNFVELEKKKRELKKLADKLENKQKDIIEKTKEDK